MTDHPDDEIAVDDLPSPLKCYANRQEREAGRVSLRAIRERQHGAEGRILVRARETGSKLLVSDRHGERILTTAGTAELDTKARTR